MTISEEAEGGQEKEDEEQESECVESPVLGSLELSLLEQSSAVSDSAILSISNASRSSANRKEGFLSCTSGTGATPRMSLPERRSPEDTVSASLPATPIAYRKKAHMSRRQKIWRSLKRRTTTAMRSREETSFVPGTESMDSQLQDRLTQSQPNLTDDESRGRTEKRKKTSKSSGVAKHLKSIMRGGSLSRTNSRPDDSLGKRDSKVEFSELNDVIGNGSVGDPRVSDTTIDTLFTSDRDPPADQAHNQGGLESSVNEGETDSAPYVTFLLKILLREGRDLVIRDASGSSDPYVKFKYQNKLIYKSNTVLKSLNPKWDEEFSILIDDPTEPVTIEVFDYDRFAMDDFMGSALLDLSQLRLNQPIDFKVVLEEEGNDEYMGYLNIQVVMLPQTQDQKEQFMRRSVRISGSEAPTAVKTPQKGQVWNSIVSCTLVEAKNLIPTDTTRNALLPEPYIKFKLGAEKFKCKPGKGLDPKWRERFDLYIYDETNQSLDVTVHDKRKNFFMGRCCIDLKELTREITHQRWFDLEDGAGSILLLVTVSGTKGSDTVGDLSGYHHSVDARNDIIRQYKALNFYKNMKDIGHITVKVFKAQGLAAADIGGKSDPFCVLELVNARLQTHTEFKTLNPEWNKIFTFNVKDVHSVLEVIVFDEDPNKKAEFLGKVAIPLLKVGGVRPRLTQLISSISDHCNYIKNGEKRWYALKDRKLRHRAKGQILLEMELVYNSIRASIRTFNPKEEKYVGQELKFRRQQFMRSVNKLKQFGQAAAEGGAFIKSAWSWESPARSILCFIAYMMIVYSFELYMIPLALLMLFAKSLLYNTLVGSLRIKEDDEEYADSEDEDDLLDEGRDDGSKKNKKGMIEERKSIKERFQVVQDTLAQVQEALDMVVAHLEKIRNTFNFTSKFLSWLAVFVLSVAAVILYYVPLRWLLMAWGVNKFTKKLRKPNYIDNNELLDFLSRVPSDTENKLYAEYRPDPVVEPRLSGDSNKRKQGK